VPSSAQHVSCFLLTLSAAAAAAAAAAVLCSLLLLCCCSIFFYEATHGSLTAISSLTFLTPMFAAGAGFMFLGETLTPVQLIGAAITLAAVFMINTPASHKPREGAAKKE
jgi:drug/metabolite transporter (DMT)-like permease